MKWLQLTYEHGNFVLCCRRFHVASLRFVWKMAIKMVVVVSK